MGQIVAAMATVHAPQLFTRPPSEDPAQLDADIAAMRELGRTMEATKPDAVIVVGSDHLETFFLSSVPTFAIVSNETTKARFAGREYNLPVHSPLAEDLLDRLVHAGFDMAYSQDAILGHAFAAVYEWVIEGRAIPVVPVFVNAYLPPLPTARRCAALGRAIRDIVASRPERVAIIASGGMSHYPGTWKYPQPAFDFDWWAIAHMERGNHDKLLDLTNEQLDEVGNTEMLPWMVVFGAIGNQPGELLSYQPTWHHGHAVMRFIPNLKGAPSTPEPGPDYEFQNAGGYQFYKHPDPASYKLNKIIFDLRHDQKLRMRLFENAPTLAAEYGLSPVEAKALETLKDETIDVLRSLKSHPLVEVGAHPLGMLMCLVVVQAEQRRLKQHQAAVTN
jgi:aromatic ring-opening dioxygenase catalytic subunit (LigB family)